MRYINIPKIVKVINFKNKYYTSYLEDRLHIYSFLDEQNIKKCINFCAEYKKKFGDWPELNDTINNQKLNVSYVNNNINTLNTLRSELVIKNILIDDIYTYCKQNNMGLLGITDFEYSILNNKIDINFKAADLIPKDFYITKSIDDDIKKLNELI
jgi:hypothetical protein